MQKKLPIELHFVERKDIHVSLCCWTHTTTSPPQSWLCLDTAGGGALWDVLYPVEVVSGSSQHEESLLTVPVHQGLQRKPAGTQSQPQIQPAGTVCQCVCECMCVLLLWPAYYLKGQAGLTEVRFEIVCHYEKWNGHQKPHSAGLHLTMKVPHTTPPPLHCSSKTMTWVSPLCIRQG